MEAVIQKFRGALGGFNRRDVLQYIEQTAAAHRREVAELEKELARSEQERQELETALSGIRDEKGTVAAEEARVRASLEASTATLTRLRGELSETEHQLAAARAELEGLQRQVEELAPMARSYQELKDRVATVELDAHRKAQATVDEARRQAEELREETLRWLDEVSAQYGAVRQAVDELFRSAHAISTLEEQAREADRRLEELKRRSGQE